MTFKESGTQPSDGIALPIAKKRDRKSVYDIAHEAFDTAKGDTAKAAQLMERRVKSNRALLSELSEEFIKLVCKTATGTVLRAERRAVWLPPNYDPGGKGNRVNALAAGNEEMLMRFPLPGGKLLGDATHEELLDASEMYAKQAADMDLKARWLGMIAERVPEGKCAREVLNERQLQKMREEAANA